MAYGARFAQPPDGLRMHRAMRDRAQGKPRRTFPRRLSGQERRVRQSKYRHRQEQRRDEDSPRPNQGNASRAEADHRGKQVSTEATFRIWRGDASGGDFQEYKAKVEEGTVVLDVVHLIQAEQANDLAVRWNCKACKCASCSAGITW